MPPRIAFAGAGSIGSVVGGLMSSAGHDVTLVDAWTEHVQAMNANGLRLSGTLGDRRVPVRAVLFQDLSRVREPFDVVFITVKSYDTERIATTMLPHAAPGATFVSLQNCMNDERLSRTVGGNRTLGCVTTISTGLVEPGHAARTDALDAGTYLLGEIDGRDTARARALVELVGAAGRAYLTTELMAERWAKLAGNCSTNALVGITGYGTVQTLLDPTCRRIAIHAAAEAVTVAAAAGQKVNDVMGIRSADYVDAVRTGRYQRVESGIEAYTKKTKNSGVASLGQDVKKGRKTEIDFINGYVSDKGRELGIPTPVCDALVRIFHEQPVGAFKSDPKLLEPLFRSLSR